MKNFLASIVLALLAFVAVPGVQGLYLGMGGVVGKNITPRTGSSYPGRTFGASGTRYSVSGRSRSRDYGVIYGRYQPSGIRPFSSKGK